MEVPRSVLVLAKREIILNADQIGHINQVIMETFNNAHNVSFKGSSCIEFTIAIGYHVGSSIERNLLFLMSLEDMNITVLFRYNDWQCEICRH